MEVDNNNQDFQQGSMMISFQKWVDSVLEEQSKEISKDLVILLLKGLKKYLINSFQKIKNTCKLYLK